MLPKILFLDDCYPEKSTFRILEGDLLFKHFPRSKHSKHVYHPDFEREKFDFAYTIGIGPCLERLPIFEKCKMPFVFECYQTERKTQPFRAGI